ncbi:hypothetical protein JKP88DRAFT_154361, partial [Tribonema minus]
DGAAPAQQLLFRGTKIVGDPHVPAGRCSFLVDLARDYDVDAEIAAASTGLVVVFGPNGAQVLDLGLRAPAVARWCKGRGQVNMRSDRWAPTWVDVDCLLYRTGAGAGGAAEYAYSIIWREPTHGIRILVDFRR